MAFNQVRATRMLRKAAELMRVVKCDVPHESAIAARISPGDFHDAYRILKHGQELQPLEVYARMVNPTPTWVNTLLTLRNKMVMPLGLKDVGTLGDIDPSAVVYQQSPVGARLDIFTIESLTRREMVAKLDDRHLDIRLSVLSQRSDDGINNVVVSTLVKKHNVMGDAYMAFIKPFHERIVQRLMRNI